MVLILKDRIRIIGLKNKNLQIIFILNILFLEIILSLKFQISIHKIYPNNLIKYNKLYNNLFLFIFHFCKHQYFSFLE